MEPEPEGDLAERRECYKLVLDRYQTFLSFCADMSLKCLTIGFGFYGFFFAVHKDSGPKSVSGIDCKTRVMILVVAALFGALYSLMQFKYWKRATQAFAYLQSERKRAKMPSLAALGILTNEHNNIFLAWSVAVLAIVVSIFIVIGGWSPAGG